MCVEAGKLLILTDLDMIYGNFLLFIAVNNVQSNNLTTVHLNTPYTKYFARVALGAHSNPMLYVNPEFKCILVMDEKKLEHTDPPLLNRFEKQRLTINDLLLEHHISLCKTLNEWVQQISMLEQTEAQNKNEFSVNDIFIGYDKEETIQSLVFDQCKKDGDIDDDLILRRCKERLIDTATSDGIVRAKQSILSKQKPDEVVEWTDQEGQLIIINTFSNINTDIKACLNEVTCQIDKLSTFKTEAQLQNRIKHFWLDSDDELLILQLAKFIIEQIREKYKKKRQTNDDILPKHA
ncbi:9932_t:CDS:2, partial [Racocetra fulgida]